MKHPVLIVLLGFVLSHLVMADHAPEESDEGQNTLAQEEALEKEVKAECDALGGRVYPENPTRCYCPEIGDREGTSASAEVWGAKTCAELKTMVFQKCEAEGGTMNTREGACLCKESKTEAEGFFDLSPLPGPADASGVCKKAPPPKPEPKPEPKLETKAHETKELPKTEPTKPPPPLKAEKKKVPAPEKPEPASSSGGGLTPVQIGAGLGTTAGAGIGMAIGGMAGGIGAVPGAAIGAAIGFGVGSVGGWVYQNVTWPRWSWPDLGLGKVNELIGRR